MNSEIDEPLDLIRLSLGKNVLVKCRNDRELKGKLHAYDTHLNLLISDVEEKIISQVYDEVKHTESINTEKKNFGLLFLRGDLVISVITSNK